MTLSFRPRLALWSALLSGIVLLIFFAVTAFMVFDNMTEEADDELRRFTAETVAAVYDMEEGGVPQTQLVGTLSAERAEVRLVSLSGPGGVVIYEDPGWPKLAEGEKYTRQGWSVTRRFDGKTWRVMTRSMERSKKRYRVKMAIDLREIRDEVSVMLRRYLRALPFALVFIGLGAWWVAGRAVKPIQKIIATAEQITPQGLGARVEGVKSGDDLGRLARVLNRMMDRLEGAFRQLRRFSADASHELRTPLAVMQGKIEAALQRPDRRPEDIETFAELLERVGQLRSIIDSLLLLSRSDAGSLIPERGELDLPELISDVLEDAEIIAEEHGISVESDLGDGTARVIGDGRLLRLAVSNLLTNGIKYNTGEGGRVRCELREVEGAYEVAVGNTGPAIGAGEREKIFERFYRGDPARGAAKPGFGLGLSLSMVIADVHGGRLGLESSKGGWNCFVLSLPAAPTPGAAAVGTEGGEGA